MNLKKVILPLLTVIFMLSCQKDDQELQEIEKLETSNKALRALQPVGAQSVCSYVPWTITFKAGSYSGCELVEKLYEARERFAQEIDPGTGCPKYKMIDVVSYFDCDAMNENTYVEQWKILSRYACSSSRVCPGGEEAPLGGDPDGDFHRSR